MKCEECLAYDYVDFWGSSIGYCDQHYQHGDPDCLREQRSQKENSNEM